MGSCCLFHLEKADTKNAPRTVAAAAVAEPSAKSAGLQNYVYLHEVFYVFKGFIFLSFSKGRKLPLTGEVMYN